MIFKNFLLLLGPSFIIFISSGENKTILTAATGDNDEDMTLFTVRCTTGATVFSTIAYFALKNNKYLLSFLTVFLSS